MRSYTPLSPDEIRDIRTAYNLSQEGFAQMIPVCTATYCRWENGHNAPSRLANMRMMELRDEFRRERD